MQPLGSRMIRSSSLPLSDGDGRRGRALGNPFWSSHARDELLLKTMRPSELPPVPADSDGDALLDEALDAAAGHVGRVRPVEDERRGGGGSQERNSTFQYTVKLGAIAKIDRSRVAV